MKSKYAIVCGSRTGSTLLCDLLKSTNRAGDPHEFFNKDIRPNFEKFNKKGYVDGIINNTKTENDVFGVKIVGMDQWQAFQKSPLQITHYIWLYRENRVAQAISRYKSWKLNKWHTNKPLEVSYSFEDIEWCYGEILKEEIFYSNFFKNKHHIKISYEKDLLASKDQTIRCILNHLGVNSNELPELKSDRVKISNYNSKKMELQFINDLNLKELRHN